MDGFLRNTAYTPAATVYVGLFGAATWLATHTYATSTYVLPTTYNGRIYKVTAGGGGNSAGSEPAWPTTNAGTVVDGALTWTEQSVAMDGGTFSELTGSNYSRKAITFAAATAIGGTSTGSTAKNSGAVTFDAASANWVPTLGFYVADASSAGNALLWAVFASAYAQVNNGQQLQFNANGVTLTLD